MAVYELEISGEDVTKFKGICEAAKVGVDRVIGTFISAVNEYYAENPGLVKYFSADNFIPKPIAESIYRFNEKTGKIERIGLTDKGKLLKLEELHPTQAKTEAASMEAALRGYFDYLRDGRKNQD